MRISSKPVDITTWHRVFAWLPVQIGDELVWLEFIERKADGWNGITGLTGVEYRTAQCKG